MTKSVRLRVANPGAFTIVEAETKERTRRPVFHIYDVVRTAVLRVRAPIKRSR